jgi:uncharacterized protein with PQ loop repeat
MLLPEHDHLGLKTHHHAIDYLATANAFVNGLSLYPQIYRVLITKSMMNLSALSFAIIFLTSVVWLGFGLHRRALPTIISSFLNVLGSGILLSLFLVK